MKAVVIIFSLVLSFYALADSQRIYLDLMDREADKKEFPIEKDHLNYQRTQLRIMARNQIQNLVHWCFSIYEPRFMDNENAPYQPSELKFLFNECLDFLKKNMDKDCKFKNDKDREARSKSINQACFMTAVTKINKENAQEVMEIIKNGKKTDLNPIKDAPTKNKDCQSEISEAKKATKDLMCTQAFEHWTCPHDQKSYTFSNGCPGGWLGKNKGWFLSKKP